MNDLKIIDYKPAYQAYFEAFNKAWLEEYFSVEPIDKYVLENPEEAIYKAGGCILCAIGAKRLILYSDTKLSTALAVYRKLGFKEIELEKGEYERADIMMEYES
jgi:hypothetical protein